MKIKFNLGWILAIMAAIVLAALGFFSFYYRTGGNLLLPVIVAIVLFVVPIVICAYLVPSKECSKPFYFHKEAVNEIAMLAAMLLLAVGSMFLVNHFYTVNKRADEIDKAVADQRRQLDEMQESYGNHVKGRVANYQAYLNEVANNKQYDLATYNKVFPNGSNDIGLMVRDMQNKIALDGLKDSADAVKESESISWLQLPSVMKKIDDISRVLDDNYQLMQERDHNFTADMGDNDYWEYNYTKIDDMMSYFKKPSGLTVWAVLSVVVLFFIILLPYLCAERDSRSGGLFAELSKDGKFDKPVDNPNIGRL